MKQNKSAKRSLIFSVLSLLLCCAMLVGTTFAWFTDSVTSGNNKIVAGNLDVELYHNADETVTEINNKVTEETKLFVQDLWEPGVAVFENFKVANEGTLALKYQLTVNFNNAVATPNGMTLADILKVGVVNGGVFGDRDKVVGTVDAWKPLATFDLEGDLLANESDAYGIVIWWEPSDIDNEFNMNNENKDTVLSIDLGVSLIATQMDAESDSFNNQYDANAWTEVAEVPTPDANGVVNVYTPEQLAGVMANTTGIKTINIVEDINLLGRTWAPAYVSAPDLVINGNGHTISNMTTNGKDYQGFIGVAYQNITINDLTFEKATVAANQSFTGGVIGWAWGNADVTFNNVDVIDSEVSTTLGNKAIRVGGLIGFFPYDGGNLTLNGCDVSGSTFTGYHNVGAMVGTTLTQKTVTIENCTATNNTLKYGSPNVGAFDFGASTSGYTAYEPATGFTAENNKLVAVASDANVLKSALTANKKDIHVVLSADVDLPISSLGQITGGSGEYKLGGENTEKITIDLNGYKLNVTTTYWSSIGAKNPDAVFTIKNGTMTSSQATGTWNSYDLTFANCNYVVEDVVFDKAVAFTNTDKSVTMSNVTINETHDYYALWISARGQNVNIDGLTVNSDGRAIKIDEQYVDAPAKVTLNVSNATINSVKKAAITVKSAAGADIALSNVNIANTIDPLHAVWVDEDAAAYYDLVTVTGGEKILEVSNTTALSEALAGGNTDVYLSAGTYSLPGVSNNDVTISGSKETVITVTTPAYHGSNVTFNGVTVKGSGYATGVQHVNTVTYNDVTVEGEMCLYGNKVVFNDCTFNLAKDQYIWTYGATEVEFNNCTFNSQGKALLVYGDSPNDLSTTCTTYINNCKFYAETAVDGKAAIEIDSRFINQVVYIDSLTTAEGFDEGSISGNTLWNNKKGNAATVYVNNVAQTLNAAPNN